jgi:hypothetical protein
MCKSLQSKLIDLRAELEVRGMERDERARRRELYVSWPWYRRLRVWWGDAENLANGLLKAVEFIKKVKEINNE